MPWGQGQKAAVVPPYVGVGAVPAALRMFVFNTALPGSLLHQKEARPRQEVAMEEESHRLRFPGVPGLSSETCVD